MLLLGLFGNHAGFEMHIEGINDQDIRQGPDHDQRNGKRYLKPEKRGDMRDAVQKQVWLLQGGGKKY